VRSLVAVVGEEALSERDLLNLKFADIFEERFVKQGADENRTIEQTLNLGWELLSTLPEGALKRIDEKYVKQYYKKESVVTVGEDE